MIEHFKQVTPSCDVVILADSEEFTNVDVMETCRDIARLNHKPDRVFVLSTSKIIDYVKLHEEIGSTLDIPYRVIRFVDQISREEAVYRGCKNLKSNFVYFVKAGNLVQTNFTSIIRSLINEGQYFVAILNNCTLENSLLATHVYNKFFLDLKELRELAQEEQKEHTILEWDDINET